MELIEFGKEVIHGLLEQAASYRFGQAVLKQVDRALWVVEKCARWAVPPPLDQDERPQQELVRPLPWVFFLTLLVVLRITRESISLVYLAVGKPPLRSADVVIYIQTKRRYLRTLKYQGNRILRARNASAPRQPWYKRLYALVEVTMCFRGSRQYGNNNTSVNSGDELLVVKRTKRPRDNASPVSSPAENPIERLIEKMMVDMEADFDDDSDNSLTNTESEKSDESNRKSVISAESEEQAIVPNGTSTPVNSTLVDTSNINNISILNDTRDTNATEQTLNSTDKVNPPMRRAESEDCSAMFKSQSQFNKKMRVSSESVQSMSFIQSEKCQSVSQTRTESKIANGRAGNRMSKKSKGELSERKSSDVPLARITANDNRY